VDREQQLPPEPSTETETPVSVLSEPWEVLGVLEAGVRPLPTGELVEMEDIRVAAEAVAVALLMLLAILGLVETEEEDTA
jgi:hypothetical protein